MYTLLQDVEKKIIDYRKAIKLRVIEMRRDELPDDDVIGSE